MIMNLHSLYNAEVEGLVAFLNIIKEIDVFVLQRNQNLEQVLTKFLNEITERNIKLESFTKEKRSFIEKAVQEKEVKYEYVESYTK